MVTRSRGKPVLSMAFSISSSDEVGFEVDQKISACHACPTKTADSRLRDRYSIRIAIKGLDRVTKCGACLPVGRCCVKTRIFATPPTML